MKSLRFFVLLGPVLGLALPLPAQEPNARSSAAAYVEEATAAIDSQILDKKARRKTEAIFDSANLATHVYHRNPSAWFAAYDLTCISASCSSTNDAGLAHVTAVSPGWVMSANHIGNLVGSTADFVDQNNVTHTVAIGAQVAYGENGDRVIYPITPRLPAAITPAEVLPATLLSGLALAGVPCFFTNQEGLGLVAEVVGRFPGAPPSDIIRSAVAANRTAWTANPRSAPGVSVAGAPFVLHDSTSPYGLFLGRRFVLLGCAFTSLGSGPDPGADATAINSVLATTGDSLTMFGLPGRPKAKD